MFSPVGKGGIALAVLVALAPSVRAGTVKLEFRPTAQTVNVGDALTLSLFAVSGDGMDQPVGFIGAVITFNGDSLALIGHDEGGASAWASAGFPSDGGGVNESLLDGDVYFQAVIDLGGSPAVATADGLLVTTLQFAALPAGTGASAVQLVSCIGSTCSHVLDGHPFDAQVSNVTGSLGPAVSVSVRCAGQPDCDDANPCTDDTCNADQVCANVPNDANNPDDGLRCNGVEVCAAGAVTIQPGSIPQCDDGLSCTTDRCDEATDACTYTLDAGFCLIDGVCYVDAAVNPANECEECASLVDPGLWTRRAEGASCGSAAATTCNGPDACDGMGVCLEHLAPLGTPCGSGANTLCTAPDTCDPNGFCSLNDVGDGASCDDDLFCSVDDLCLSGNCVAGSSVCPYLTCDEMTQTCKSVDLELIAVDLGPFVADDVVAISLMARSATAREEQIGSIAAVLTWNALRLELVGHDDNGPYAWMTSEFPDDSALDDLNATFLDGNAYYQASRQPEPNPPAISSPGGLLVTTFLFRAVSAGATLVELAEREGQYSQTRVSDAETAGLNITGNLDAPALVEIVACLDDGQCADGEFCNGVEACVDMKCVAGDPPDCDNGVFCDGPEVCQVGVGCTSVGNPCPDPASCNESAGNCGGCDAATATAEGSAYLRVVPPPSDNLLALYVTGDAGHAAVDCVAGFVQVDGTIGDEPFLQTPAQWGTVYVTGPGVFPGVTYQVHADCRSSGAGSLSAPAPAETSRWGDVNGDGAVGIDDVILVWDASAGNLPAGVPWQRYDLAPCVPDGIVDALDAQWVELAYWDAGYPCDPPCLECPSPVPPEPAPASVATNRFLGLMGANPGQQQAIRVTLSELPAPFHEFNGKTMWIGEPRQRCENAGQGFDVNTADCTPAPGQPRRFSVATLQCEPHHLDWSAVGPVQVYHELIVPGGLYEIQTINTGCAVAEEGNYSTPLPLVTSRFGDLVKDCSTYPCGPPNGLVEITDALGVLFKFQNLGTAPLKVRCDLSPAIPDGVIAIDDAIRVLQAFVSAPYPFPPPPDPCP